MTKLNSRPVLPNMEQICAEKKRIRHKDAYVKSLLGTFYVLIIVAAFAVLISSLLLPVLQISGSSMSPTLENGDIIVLIKTDRFKPGELCSFTWNNKTLLKRVIAVPGDWVAIDNEGTVTVNDMELKEPYLEEKSLGECDIEFPVQIGDSEYFLVGDKRSISIDSRNSIIGNVKKEQIIGKAVFRIWPFHKIGFIH